MTPRDNREALAAAVERLGRALTSIAWASAAFERPVGFKCMDPFVRLATVENDLLVAWEFVKQAQGKRVEFPIGNAKLLRSDQVVRALQEFESEFAILAQIASAFEK
jgi:hypothetical protein